jgi:hypothetical protein
VTLTDAPVTAEPAADAPRDLPAADGAPDHAATRTAAPAVTGSGLALVAAACSAGAGLVHAAMTPTHVAEWPAEGRGFAALAVAQLVVAALVVLRPRRWVAAALVAVQVPAIAGWVWSRTSGFPFGPAKGTAEAVGWVDATSTALEVLVVLFGLRLLIAGFGRGDAERSSRVPGPTPAWAAFASVAVLAGVGGLVASPEGQHHHDGADGHAHSHAAAAPLTKPLSMTVRRQLGQELTTAREVALRYPTVADAKKAGLMQAGPFTPGSASHFVDISVGMSPTFDLQKPLAWLYSGTNDTSVLVGVMYYTATDAAPEGFAGPLDVWHQHTGACYRVEPGGKIFVPFSPDHDGTKAECDAVGGDFIAQTGWMVHAWVAPGWDSPLGVFSHDHPEVLCKDGRSSAEVTDLSVGCEGT